MNLAAICSKCGGHQLIRIHKNHKFSYSCQKCIEERKKKIAFMVAAFIIGCLLIPAASTCADKVRGHDGTGGEVFLPLLSILIAMIILWVIDAIKNWRGD
jgi:hypothetical protein